MLHRPRQHRAGARLGRARSALGGCPLIGNCGHRLLFERDGSVANDPLGHLAEFQVSWLEARHAVARGFNICLQLRGAVGSTPTGIVSAGRAEKFLNVCSYQAESNIPV